MHEEDFDEGSGAALVGEFAARRGPGVVVVDAEVSGGSCPGERCRAKHRSSFEGEHRAARANATGEPPTNASSVFRSEGHLDQMDDVGGRHTEEKH